MSCFPDSSASIPGSRCVNVMDIDRQVEYWKTGAEEDLAAAESLLEKGHFRHCLFCAHLALEKMLKALVVRATHDAPPRIHRLPRLAVMAGPKLDGGQMDSLREFGAYQTEGWYPHAEQLEINADLARDELCRAKEILAWLSRQS